MIKGGAQKVNSAKRGQNSWLDYSNYKPLIILAGSFLFALILSWQVNKTIKKQIGVDVQKTLKTILNTTHESLETWSKGRLDAAQTFVFRPDFQDLVKELLSLPLNRESLTGSPALKKLRHLVKPWIENHHDLDMFVVNPDGINIASSLDKNLGINNDCLVKNNFLKRTNNSESIIVASTHCVSSVAVADNTKKNHPPIIEPVIFLGVPIKNAEDEVLAIFVVKIDPSRDFTRVIQLSNSGESDDAYSFNRDGLLTSDIRFKDQIYMLDLLKPDQDPVFNLRLGDPGLNLKNVLQPISVQKEWPLTLAVSKATSGENGANITGYRDYRGVQVVGAWKWIDHANLGLVFELDVNDAFMTYFFIRRIIIAALCFLATIFSFIFLVLQKQKQQAERLNERLNRQKSLIQNLAGINFSYFEKAICQITEGVGKTFGVEKTSIWLFTYNLSELFCVDHYQFSTGAHDRKAVLQKSEYPDFVQTFAKMRPGNKNANNIIPENLSSLGEGIHKSLSSDSTLGAVFFERNEPMGIVWCEHLDPQRQWHEDEIVFFNSIADLVRLAHESTERRRVEEQLKKHQINLEIIITERTKKLQREIQDRKSSQKRLEESEEKFKLIINSTAEGIYGVDMDEKCIFCNAACISILGYNSIHDLLGKNMHHLVHHTFPHGTPSPIDECKISKALLAGQAIHVDDEVFWRKDGNSFEVEYRSYPIIRDGVTVGAVVTFTDINKRKTTERELHHNLAEMEQFSKMVVGREQQMIKLKEEVNELLLQLGKKAQYKTLQ